MTGKWVGGDNPSNLTRKKKTYEISHTVMIFKDTIIYNALGFQYTGNLNNKRYINLSLTAYIKRRFKQIVNNSTDINRKNNLISPQTTEHRKNLHRRPWKSRSWIGTYRKLWRGLNRLMGTTSLLSLWLDLQRLKQALYHINLIKGGTESHWFLTTKHFCNTYFNGENKIPHFRNISKFQ